MRKGRKSKLNLEKKTEIKLNMSFVIVLATKKPKKILSKIERYEI